MLYFNDTFILTASNLDPTRFSSDGTIIETYTPLEGGDAVAATKIGFLQTRDDATLRYLPYDTTDSATVIDIELPYDYTRLSHQSDLLYFYTSVGERFGLGEVIDDTTINFIKQLNINNPSVRDTALYRDTLYLLTSDSISTLDIRPYRPLAKNTKTTIYPVFATNGDTIPLKQYCPDAHTLTFGVGFDKPDWLSINASDELEIASDAVTETTPVLVKLTGINYIDSVEFEFYLIIEPATAPVWRDVDSLTMRAGSSYDLHQIVDADSIALTAGETQPTGVTLSGGIFTISTTGGTAYFTATKGTLTTDFEVNIVVVQMPDPANFSDTFTYRVMISGIDVSDDLLELPEVTQSLDVILLNEYQVGEVSLTLSSDNTNDISITTGLLTTFGSPTV